MNRLDQRSSGVAASGRRYLKVAEQLLELISNGTYPQGSRIPGDRELAVSSGVSRPTVREALLALEIVGMLEIQPGAGVFVTGWAAGPDLPRLLLLDSPDDLMGARSCVEPAIAGLCAEQVEVAALKELRSCVDECAEATASGRPLSQLSELGLGFHRQLAQACSNRILGEMAASLLDAERHPLWMLVNQAALRNEEARALQVREHTAILDAIESGDHDQAHAAMAAHLAAARRAIQQT